jgi:hypothetical protein
MVASLFPDEVIKFFSWPNTSSRTVVLGSTQPPAEIIQEYSWGKERAVRKADNLRAFCETIVYKIWEPRCLRTLWASAACHSGSFIYV